MPQLQNTLTKPTFVEAKLTVVTAFSFAVLASFEALDEKILQPEAKVDRVESKSS